MSTVKIPPVLRTAARGERTIEVDGATVAEVLTNLCDLHPAIGQQILTPDGTVHKYVNVYVNDEDVRLLDWTETAVAAGDTVMILPAMAGGQ
ncbi:MAG: MoaD/ThiS family protein [Thermoleophilia bacterium]|nr:MoaD/ThiS family protein [Thermoleophilia bacterium]